MRRAGLLLLLVLTMALGFRARALAQDYMLGEGDLLKISVYENDDLATVVRVNGDGTISFPLIGQVKVSGLTVHDAEQKLTRLLSDGYVIDPHVSILVTEYWSKRVTILGEITKPGLYELNGNVTLVEIISRAGGLTDKAGDTLAVQRKKTDNRTGGQEKTAVESISVNLKDLMEKGDMSANLSVQDGDSIFINRAGFVYVTGEVNKPGQYKIDRGTTVIMAIALAGGLTNKAAPGRTSIIRKEGDGSKLRVDMNFPVAPDDVITVPESFF